MSPRKILSIAVVAIGIGVRVMTWGGDDAPAPVADSAPVAGEVAAAPATQPVSQNSAPAPAPAPAAAATAPAKPAAKLPRQSDVFPARFEKRVFKVCTHYERLIDTTVSAKRVDRFERLRRMIRATEDLAAEYERMTPPARNEIAWQRYTGFYRDASDLFGKIEAEIADGDRPAYDRHVARSEKLGAQERRINARYGFADCSND